MTFFSQHQLNVIDGCQESRRGETEEKKKQAYGVSKLEWELVPTWAGLIGRGGIRIPLDNL